MKRALTLTALLALPFVLRADAPNVYAIRGARIVTAAGAPIENGTVVVRRGVIDAVGASVTVPPEAAIIEGAGITVYPGLIDTCSNYVEHPELIAQRLARFIDIVGVERVIASTDCGFGTFAGYGKIDPAVTWMKLRALRGGADLAAARLTRS